MTFEQYLKQYSARATQEYRAVATVNADGIVSFYIHPMGRSGDTPIYAVVGNTLTPVVVDSPTAAIDAATRCLATWSGTGSISNFSSLNVINRS